jgi:ubiquinone/menaquinone biosynthesis C-methylase UbiE
MTCLYDFLAPAYDPAFGAIFRPFRERAFEHVPAMPGATALDLACGTGQNFALLAERLGPRGTIFGVDVSAGMLRRARRRAERLTQLRKPEACQRNSRWLSPALRDDTTGTYSKCALIPEGSQLAATPAGVDAFSEQNRWWRSLRDLTTGYLASIPPGWFWSRSNECRNKESLAMFSSAIDLLQLDAAKMSTASLHPRMIGGQVDLVTCTYGFTAIGSWQAAFANSWDLLAPGGRYLILDVDGRRRNLHTRAVEIATRSNFSRPIWQALRSVCADFRMDYLEPSAHLFGGRLFVASGTKPLAAEARPCPS